MQKSKEDTQISLEQHFQFGGGTGWCPTSSAFGGAKRCNLLPSAQLGRLSGCLCHGDKGVPRFHHHPEVPWSIVAAVGATLIPTDGETVAVDASLDWCDWHFAAHLGLGSTAHLFASNQLCFLCSWESAHQEGQNEVLMSMIPQVLVEQGCMDLQSHQIQDASQQTATAVDPTHGGPKGL